MAIFEYVRLAKYLSGVVMKYAKQFYNEEAEWMEYFNEQKVKSDELKSQIAQTDSEIDWMVCELYGLNGEEMRVVERG